LSADKTGVRFDHSKSRSRGTGYVWVGCDQQKCPTYHQHKTSEPAEHPLKEHRYLITLAHPSPGNTFNTLNNFESSSGEHWRILKAVPGPPE
jgi:hypothetical protein